MPSAINTVSGSGKITIATPAITVLEIAIKLITPGPLVHLVGPAGFRRLFQSAWVAVGNDSGASPPDLINFWMWHQVEYEDVRLNGRNIFADAVFYDCSDGTTIEIEVDW